MRILIQGPMKSETDLLFSMLENPEKKTIDHFEFAKGEIEYEADGDKKQHQDAAGEGKKEKVELVVSRTHIGLVYAALATKVGIDEYHPDVVIIQGTSGAHNPDRKFGDIIIGESYVNIDAYVTDRKGASAGQGEPDYLFHCFEDLKGGKWEEPEQTDSPVFCVDKTLVEIAMEAASGRDDVYVGIIGSGFSWNRMADKLLEMREKIGTDVEEMETFAVAKTCEIYGVPVLPIRVVSNSEFTGEEFDEKIAKKCQEFSVEVAIEIARKYKR